MRTQGELIRTLQRRVDFLKTRDHRNSYDQAELGALEWALVNLPPPQRTWVWLTDDEIEKMGLSNYIKVVRETEAKLKEKNT